MSPRRLIPLLAVLAATAGLAASCGGSSSSSSSLPSGVACEVNGDQISKADVDQLMGQAEATYKAQKKPFPSPGSQEFQALQGQAVTFLLQREQYAQKAKQMGIKVTDEQVDKRLKQIKKQYFKNDQKKYLAQLKKQGLTEAVLREDLRSQLVSQAISDKVVKDVTVTSEEAKDYYLQNPAQYSQPRSRDVRHILVPDKQTAERIYTQLKGGSDFAKLAKKYSQDPGSKANGGKLTVREGETVPEFDKLAFALKTNELGKPVKTTYGWHVIQALGPIKPRQTTPFDKVEKTIKETLLNNKKSQALQVFSADLAKEFESKVDCAKGFEPAAASTSTTPAPTTG